MRRQCAGAVAVGCVLAIGCATPPPADLSNSSTGGVPGQTVELEPQASRSGTEYVGTGEAFDGPFMLGDSAVIMTASGEFTRVRRTGVQDAGSYLVTADGKLVLFLERIGDAKLTTARPEVHPRAELVPAP